MGTGSAELATTTEADGVALVLQAYQGTRLDAITDLKYATYRQTVDSGNNLAIALQFNVDYDVTDQAAGYQGRLVFEPYQGNGGGVSGGAWQTWDAKAGKWWGTRASVTARDALTIGANGVTTTFDFEQTGRWPVPLIPPGMTPRALFDSLGTVTASTPGIDPGPYRRDIVIVKFRPGTPLAARQAAIDSVGGQVVGGYRNPDGQDGTYYVRISGGTFGALSQAVLTLMRQPQVGFASWWQLSTPDIQSHRRRHSRAGSVALRSQGPRQ
jgi:hypothetical protein